MYITKKRPFKEPFHLYLKLHFNFCIFLKFSNFFLQCFLFLLLFKLLLNLWLYVFKLWHLRLFFTAACLTLALFCKLIVIILNFFICYFWCLDVFIYVLLIFNAVSQLRL